MDREKKELMDRNRTFLPTDHYRHIAPPGAATSCLTLTRNVVFAKYEQFVYISVLRLVVYLIHVQFETPFR